jgi:hypothetical protein
MNTSLSLLTREGAVVVTFASVLTPAQYANLFDHVQRAGSKPELEASLSQFAEEHGLTVTVDEPFGSLQR